MRCLLDKSHRLRRSRVLHTRRSQAIDRQMCPTRFKNDSKSAASPFMAFHLHRSSVRVNQFTHQRKPDARAFVRT